MAPAQSGWVASWAASTDTAGALHALSQPHTGISAMRPNNTLYMGGLLRWAAGFGTGMLVSVGLLKLEQNVSSCWARQIGVCR